MTTTTHHKKENHPLTQDQTLAFIEAVAGGVPYREALVLANIPEPLSRAQEHDLEALQPVGEALCAGRNAIVPSEDALARLLAKLPSVTTSLHDGASAVDVADIPSPFAGLLVDAEEKRVLRMAPRFVLPLGVPFLAVIMLATVVLSSERTIAPVLTPTPDSFSFDAAGKKSPAPTSFAMAKSATSVEPEAISLALADQTVIGSEPAPVLMMMRSVAPATPQIETLDDVGVLLNTEADMEIATVAADVAAMQAYSSDTRLLDELSLYYDATEF
jgi:hypothetical protein